MTSASRTIACAIARAHRQAGHLPATSDPRVLTVLEGIARVHGSAPNKKTALLRDPLLELIDRIDASTPAGLRDRALLLLGFAVGLRRSELVALTVEDLSPSPDGLRIRIARSKPTSTPAGTAAMTTGAIFRRVTEHNGLVLREQPITNLRNDAVERAELLIRMRTNHQELVAPALFLPVAERFGQIRAIDRWVIDRALQLLRQPAQPRVCHVNVSGATMTDPELIDTLPAKIAREASDPSRLAFEITETVAIENIEHAHQLIERLAALGCQIVLDDFGSGFGSFYYLKHLRFDSLKIAGEFIKQITTSKTDRVTVQAIVEMARGLEKTTIAECVEDQATLELVRELGVDYAQGHHLGKPEPNDHVDGVDEHAVR